MQLGDLLPERLADPLHGLEFVARDQPGQFLLFDRLERAGSALVRPHLERILALQFEQRPDLGQHIRDFVLGHNAGSKRQFLR